ncbi:MAG: hypothetical protein RLZZ262_1586 [Bacteroidota bacterium]
MFCLRLIGITHAPIEVNHNWRQSTVAMVARNFYEVDPNLYFPRLDFGGAADGISAMEFPLLNYLVYVVSTVFGYDHWYGRLINLLITSLGLYFFYRLVADLFTERRAFISTLLLGTSIWFTFGRKIMPDTMAVSLILMSIYSAWRYLRDSNSNLIYALTSGLLFALGAMSKLPAALPMILVPVLVWHWGTFAKKITLTSVFVICSLPVLHWYWIWTPYLTDVYGMTHFFMGKSVAVGAHEILVNIGVALGRIFVGPLKYIGGLAFICATGWILYKKEKTLILALSATTIGLIALMCKSGATFNEHDYYIIPFVPIFALLVAYLIEQLPTRYSTLLLIVIIIESLSNQYHDLTWKKSYEHYTALETLMDRFTPKEALVAINCSPNPSAMYFTHRKGWLCTNEELMNHRHLTNMQDQGLEFVLICKERFGQDLELSTHQLLFENDQFRLYHLTPAESSFGFTSRNER